MKNNKANKTAVIEASGFNLTPRQILGELNRYIVGQEDAKKAVSIALRNRIRRRMVTDPVMQEEIVPKNILMIGPTGVGKTEIARRLAKIVGAPFIKTEATKFTEVGYVGKDVESIIRDLLENAINITRTKMRKEVQDLAYESAIQRILEVLVGENAQPETIAKYKSKIESGELDDQEIEIEVQDNPPPSTGMAMLDMPGSQVGVGVMSISDVIKKAMGIDKNSKVKKLTVKEAFDIILKEESDKIIDEEKVIKKAMELTEQDGIVFIDEIDKLVARSETRGSGDVSREGVQRDLLPLIEGTFISTKYGTIKTDHILFIASGAFHIAKPSDLLPELQGRLPIRVELQPLSKHDLVRVLTEPEHNLLKQYQVLMATEKVKVEFSKEGIERIADISTTINRDVENIGARRLHTILEKLLEDISFRAGDDKTLEKKTVKITEEYVDTRLKDLITHIDLSKFIL